ncbi:unnamed protein product [Rotaria sordida]|uniref:Uncharacterized protein n=1 Tax=Rotaria sordida TaxID=392033 RepID=A0A818VZN0_9BILA|nr:unnamed protein product [Rotaria sordida]CAF1138223.1 unnamed protein product [Rotaria sordida]CAF1366092.1 unnamed protein product [Rotaria sordida]CAF3717642.1 unnamed protein product [Rotaria sordida]
MLLKHRPVGLGSGLSLGSPTTQASRNQSPVSDNSPVDHNTLAFMILAILVPIAFTIILCFITYCIYRYNKSLSSRASTNSSIVPPDRFDPRTATVIYNTQHSSFIFEESPPSYDSLTDNKKDSSSTITNTNEQLPNTTLTNTNERTVEAAIIIPTAPTPPPPPYINLDESNKS